ncbi:MAG: helix-turn-helix domain-containing protein [Rhizobiales bacterium]|nr:helix-turn-helix domain-containing protein [Hyphomicrobiales bacterium]
MENSFAQQSPAPDEWRVQSKNDLRASGQVQSLNRALKIMLALGHHGEGLSLSAIARMVGLPTSTAHRLLTTLQNERFVVFDGSRLKWRVGAQAHRVGQAYSATE